MDKIENLALAFFFRNEAACLRNMLDQLAPLVSEIVGVDDLSTDDSASIVKSYNGRVYKCGLRDFASMRTIAAHLCKSQVVLMIDPDERLRWAGRLRPLVNRLLDDNNEAEAFALPRRRWLDLGMKQEFEPGGYPDWQVRLFKNKSNFVFQRPVHEYFHGGAVTHLSFDELPEISHFDRVFKTNVDNKRKERFYLKLMSLDGPAAFTCEVLQQQMQRCNCQNEEQPCELCNKKREIIKEMMHKLEFSWDDIKNFCSGKSYEIDIGFFKQLLDLIYNIPGM